jgi:hypothetical protein
MDKWEYAIPMDFLLIKKFLFQRPHSQNLISCWHPGKDCGLRVLLAENM